MPSDRNSITLPSVRRLLRRWTDWLRRRKRLAEVERLDAAAAAAIAREVGTGAPELRALAGKWPDTSADLLARRLGALNLDPARLSARHPAVAQDLSRLCTLCADKSRCRHDLARRPESATWQSYCPNTGTLTALQHERDQPMGRKP
ncbi:MAG: hypothetical protein K2Z80_32745 [Xanthobacteraceae bacterium]|nr:hypothetical protein [Xanthobacteraceae bacterium]